MKKTTCRTIYTNFIRTVQPAPGASCILWAAVVVWIAFRTVV